MNDRIILCIPDLHEPYAHPDAPGFLAAVKKEFKPTDVVCIGDEADHHTISFHDKDPDVLFSPSSELEKTIDSMQCYYKLFPNVTVLESNHGSLYYRKLKSHGLPKSVLKGYNEILEAPEGWIWKYEHKIDNILFRHMFASNITNAVKSHGCNLVQGHFHTKFNIDYVTYGNSFNWGMTIGCLIDYKQLAFNYAKANLANPMLGVGLIIYGNPFLLPMRLNSKGRWVGNV